jgi:voltage-gated potassium channel
LENALKSMHMGGKENAPKVSETIRHRWRFAVVLIASLLLSVAQPLTSGLLNEESTFDVFSSILVVAVLLMVFDDRKNRRIAVTLGLLAFAGIWVSVALGRWAGQLPLVISHLLVACFLTFALFGILRGILIQQASGDAIFGAICGYLLLGIIWTLLFCALEAARPGSFNLPISRNASVAAAPLDRGVLSYYSFITLATVGYGDVTPTSPLARTLAWVEAVTGQFYLAILVAGLVGYKVAQSMKADETRKGENHD